MKQFDRDGLSYRKVQKVNNGEQWRCDYPGGEYALAMVYKSKPTQRDIIEAIDAVNERSDYENA